MERVFVNLIGNALEAMPGGGEVRISAEMQDGAAVVHVEDNGPGIAPEIRAQLFQPFVSAGKRNGLGLGPGALAADRAGSRRRHVGGVRPRPRRALQLPPPGRPPHAGARSGRGRDARVAVFSDSPAATVES